MPPFSQDFEVISKTKKKATVFSGFWSDLQNKKKVFKEKGHRFLRISKWSQKKKKRSSVFHMPISQCHLNGPSAGPPEINGTHDGPPSSSWAT